MAADSFHSPGSRHSTCLGPGEEEEEVLCIHSSHILVYKDSIQHYHPTGWNQVEPIGKNLVV